MCKGTGAHITSMFVEEASVTSGRICQRPGQRLDPSMSDWPHHR